MTPKRKKKKQTGRKHSVQ